MELRHYGTILLKWWWLLLLGTLLAGATSYYVSIFEPPTYRASTTILVNQAQDTRGLDYNSVLTSERLTRTYGELIKKTPVLDATIKKLQLPYEAAQLARSVSVRVIRDTQLLEISVEHRNGEQARDIANTVTEVFIAQRLEDQLGMSSASREVLHQQLTDLERELKTTSHALEEAKAARNPQAGEVARLQNTLSQSQITYSQLLKSEQDMLLAEARTFSSIKVAEPASTPLKPVRPNPLLNTLLAAMAGLVLALGFAFLRDYLDDTVKVAADVQRAVELATLGTVARIPSDRAGAQVPRLLGETVARSPLGEAYRILRANIGFAWAGKQGQVLMMTSSNPQEGKTTTLSNLAMVLAKDNRSVIMVDADLRRPSLHRSFGLEATRGLSNLLADPHARAGDYLLPTKTPKLWLLASGPIPPNPSELLGSARFTEVLEELKTLADLILVDTPPLLAVADPALIAAQADGVLMVVEAGVTRVQALVRSSEMLRRSSTRILGVVLNKLAKGSDDYYYHYYHRYYGAEHSSANGANNGTSNGADKEQVATRA